MKSAKVKCIPRLTTRYQIHKIKVDTLFSIKFANTILSQLPRTCFAVLVVIVAGRNGLKIDIIEDQNSKVQLVFNRNTKHI